MHEIFFLLVDFSVGLISFLCLKKGYTKICTKKHLSKKKVKKNTRKKKMFHITFLQHIPIEDM